MVEPQFGTTPEECYLRWGFWYESDLACFQLVWEETDYPDDY